MDKLDETILALKWYAVVNDTIGGWCIKLENTPSSAGGIEIADFMSKEVAEYIVELHNRNIKAS